MTEKEKKEKFGVTKAPVPASRVLVKKMKHDVKKSVSLLIINDKTGTITSANVYGGLYLGRKYDPSKYAHPLPAKDDGKWAEYAKRGYKEGKVEDFDVLVKAKRKYTKRAKAKATAK